MSSASPPAISQPMPRAPGPPLVGSLVPMVRDPVRFLVDSYRECGPVFRLNVLGRRFVVLAGVDANQFVTRNERAHLASGPVFGGFGRELGGELFLASADGDTHKRLRRIQTGSYKAGHIEERAPEIIGHLRRRLGGLREGQRLDVQRLFQLVLAEQVGLALHGEAALGHILDDLIRVFRGALDVHVIERLPALVLRRPAYDRARKRILAHAEAVAEAHRRRPNSDAPDLVDDVLAAVARGDTIREENVRLLTLGPLFGGIDTASNTSAFALHAILSRPAVRARVMAEVEAVFAAGESPPWSAFEGMSALRGAIMETLRMYPVAYLAPRHVQAGFDFAGHHVPAGERLFVATAVPHFLPELYPDPYTFDIDRYGPDRREHAQRGAFAPFGTGVHSCLGARFAQSQILLTLATMLRLLDLEVDPPDYALKVKSNPVTMPVGLAVRVRGVDAGCRAEAEPWPAFSIESRRGLRGWLNR